MKMNLKQTKITGLTMELALKAKEYEKLCQELEKLKENNINPNDKRLLEIKKLFEKNQEEIIEIKKQIEKI